MLITVEYRKTIDNVQINFYLSMSVPVDPFHISSLNLLIMFSLKYVFLGPWISDTVYIQLCLKKSWNPFKRVFNYLKQQSSFCLEIFCFVICLVFILTDVLKKRIFGIQFYFRFFCFHFILFTLFRFVLLNSLLGQMDILCT